MLDHMKSCRSESVQATCHRERQGAQSARACELGVLTKGLWWICAATHKGEKNDNPCLSLSLSLSHTHTHTDLNDLSVSLSFTHTHTHSFFTEKAERCLITHAHKRTRMHKHAQTYTCTPPHTHPQAESQPVRQTDRHAERLKHTLKQE